MLMEDNQKRELGLVDRLDLEDEIRKAEDVKQDSRYCRMVDANRVPSKYLQFCLVLIRNKG